MSHRDTVFEAPPGFAALASSTESPVAAIEDVERGLYGIQFHPEVVHTPYGTQILETLPAGHLRLRHALERRLGGRGADRAHPRAGRRRQGDLRAVRRRGLVGGRAARLPAIGDQLTCVFVDHGLMRKNEGNQVVAAFRDQFKVPLIAVDAEERFLARLAGVTDPETKRKIIGEEFIRVFEEEAARARRPAATSCRARSTRT